MGIIKRQGIKSTIVNYIGALIGAIAVLRVYPLNDELYGYAQWLYATALLFVPFATGGILSLVVKYFPSYNKDDDGHYHGFLTLLLSGLILFFGLFLLLWFLFRDAIIRFLEWAHIPQTHLIVENQTYLLGLLGLMILIRFLVQHSANGLRIVVPDLIEKLGYKVFLPLLILCSVWFGMNQRTFAYALLGFFLLVVIVLLIYLRYLGILRFGPVSKPKGGESYKEMGKYAFFGSLNLLGTNFSTRLDAVMIPLFINMVENGFYGKAAFISNVMDYPTRSITSIASPIISKAWDDKNMSEIDMIYKKASANLFLLGAFVFLVIWFLLDDLIALSANPATFPNARNIFLVLAIGKMADMLTSVNTHILVYSKDYRYNLLFLLILGIGNIAMNVYFIPRHGIVGAAMATAISVLLYNIIKSVFIYWRFKLHPFSTGLIKTAVLLALFIGLYFLLPSTDFAILNIIYKSFLVGTGYIACAYFWNISEDANDLGIQLLNRIFKQDKT